ncbi:unnamed protein product, partial [marine sediment metagenome]
MVDKMGIRFAAVPKSHVAKTPNYIGAAGLDQRQRQQADALRTQQIGEGIALYDKSTGDNDYIADALFPDSSVNTEATPLGDMDLMALEDGGATAAPQSELASVNMTPLVDEGASSLTTPLDPTAAQMVNPIAEQELFSNMAQEEMVANMAAEEAAMAGLAETAVTDVAADAALNAGAENV